MIRVVIKLLFVGLCIEVVYPLCKSTHITTCDSFKDIEDNGFDPEWRELVVGPGDHSNSDTFNPMKNLHTYIGLKSLTILGQINEIVGSEQQCWMDGDLRVLSFYGNNISHLIVNSFPTVKLETLILANNNIETIDVGTFNGPQVEFLDLSHNLIETIEVGVFNDPLRPTNHTKRIDLSNNKISVIHANSFPISLNELNLNNNKLELIHEEVFKNLEDLQKLTLSGNSLHRYPYIWTLKNVIILDFSRNHLDLIPDNNMKHLGKLSSLDLSYNAIKEVPSFGFLPNTSDITLSLAFNYLSNLEKSAFEEQTLELHLYGNPWLCKHWGTISKILNETEQVRQTTCDADLFGHEDNPYCVTQDEIKESDYEKYQKQFIDVIEKIPAGKHCDLRYRKSVKNFNIQCIL